MIEFSIIGLTKLINGVVRVFTIFISYIGSAHMVYDVFWTYSAFWKSSIAQEFLPEHMPVGISFYR